MPSTQVNGVKRPSTFADYAALEDAAKGRTRTRMGPGEVVARGRIVEAKAEAHGSSTAEANTNAFTYYRPLRGVGATIRGANKDVAQITVQMSLEQHAALIELREFSRIAIAEIVRRALDRYIAGGTILED